MSVIAVRRSVVVCRAACSSTWGFRCLSGRGGSTSIRAIVSFVLPLGTALGDWLGLDLLDIHMLRRFDGCGHTPGGEPLANACLQTRRDGAHVSLHLVGRDSFGETFVNDRLGSDLKLFCNVRNPLSQTALRKLAPVPKTPTPITTKHPDTRLPASSQLNPHHQPAPSTYSKSDTSTKAFVSAPRQICCFPRAWNPSWNPSRQILAQPTCPGSSVRLDPIS